MTLWIPKPRLYRIFFFSFLTKPKVFYFVKKKDPIKPGSTWSFDCLKQFFLSSGITRHTFCWEGIILCFILLEGPFQPNMQWNSANIGPSFPLIPSLIPVHPQALRPAPNIWNYVIPIQRDPVAPDPYTVHDNSYLYSSK